jgi:membrane protein YdbS with pleckstrin-like domain
MAGGHIFTVRAHARKLVFPAALTIGLPVAAPWAAAGAAKVDMLADIPHRPLAIWAAAGVLWVWRALWPALAWRCSTDTLTGGELTSEQGVVVKSSTTIPLERVAAVNVRRTALDRVFGSGTVEVQTAGTDSTVRLSAVPHVRRVESLLRAAVHDAQTEAASRAEPNQTRRRGRA